MVKIKYLILIFLILFFVGQVQADQDTLRPTSDDHSTWYDYPAATDDYEKIDEVSPDGDDTYLWMVLAGSGITYWQGWCHTAWTAGTIDSVMLTLRHKSIATSGSPELVFGRSYRWEPGIWLWCTNDRGTDTISLGSSYANDSITWLNDPYDGNAWTQAKLNATCGIRGWAWENKAVGVKADSFGNTSAATSFSVGANYIWYGRFQADFTGTIDSLSIVSADATPNGSCALGIYSDSGSGDGYPYQRLDTTASFAFPKNAETTQPLVTGGVSITENVYYWIPFRLSAANTCKREAGPASNCGRYRAYSFGSVWPATASVSLTGEQIHYALQGFGYYAAQNRVTQSFLTVFYQPTVAAEFRRRKMIITGE